MRVFDEYKYAQKLLDKGLSKFMCGSDLFVLAKYFRSLGQNDNEIELSLIEFCKNKVDGFVETIYADMLTSISKNSKKSGMRIPVPVPITINELNKIKELKNYRYEKIMFVMLAIGKYFKLTNTNVVVSSSKSYFIKEKFSHIMRLAHTSSKKGEMIESVLFNGGYIDHLNRSNNNDPFVIKFTDIEDDSEVVIMIDDMNNVVDYYPFSCEKCGKYIYKNSNRHKMCEDCWKEKEKIRKQNRLWTKKV